MQSLSVECGMNTGCLKIFKKAAQFDEYNTFIPPHRRGEDIQLFRGDDDDDSDDDDKCRKPINQWSCTITEKAPTRAFSWLKAPTSAFTFKTLLKHYALC